MDPLSRRRFLAKLGLGGIILPTLPLWLTGWLGRLSHCRFGRFVVKPVTLPVAEITGSIVDVQHWDRCVVFSARHLEGVLDGDSQLWLPVLEEDGLVSVNILGDPTKYAAAF